MVARCRIHYPETFGRLYIRVVVGITTVFAIGALSVRILHTADWHLGKTLEGRDRMPEQVQMVDEICQLCDDEQIDVVFIAGDIYQSFNPSASAEALFYEALERLSNRGRRAVVVIAGNHDSPDRLAAPGPLADRHGITLIGLPAQGLGPTTYAAENRSRRLQAGPCWLEVAAPSCQHTAIIAALPYPSEARLNELLSARLDEAVLQQAYRDRVQKLFTALATRYRADTVNLAMSHLFVRGGVESESEVQIQVGGAYAVDVDVFPEEAQYVALGHLHRPQQMRGASSPVRYAGSPLTYSFSEVGHAKSVMVIFAEPGRPVELREVPLSSGRPLVRWTAAEGIAQVFHWIDAGRDANAWIDLELHVQSGLTLGEIQQLRSAHPGFVHIRPSFQAGSDAPADAVSRHTLSPEALFIRFYEQREGAPPNEELVRLFLELAASSAAENDAVSATEPADAAEEVRP